jgi:hypothetical protein
MRIIKQSPQYRDHLCDKLARDAVGVLISCCEHAGFVAAAALTMLVANGLIECLVRAV